MPIRRSPARLIATLGVAALALPAVGDTTYRIQISNHVDEAQPSCTVEVWAEFDQDLFALAAVEFDLLATPDAGGFSAPERVMDGPGTRDGFVAPGQDSVFNILAGQIKHLPKEPHLDFGNPALVWRGTWSTNDFTPRTIDLTTQSRIFQVYASDKFDAYSYMGPLVEGSGQIRVGGCFADCNEDGITDLFDFLCFTNQFNGVDPTADCDGNSIYDIFDFLCFVNGFNHGC